jgi:two-component system NtrC family sensor kinase
VLLVAVHGFLSMRQESSLLEETMRSDARLLGRGLAALVADVWRTNGESRALSLVEDVDRSEARVQIRLVRPDVEPPDPRSPRLDGADLAPLSEGRLVSRTLDLEPEGESIVTYAPIDAGGGIRAAVELVESTAALHEHERSAILRIAGLSLALALLTGATAVVLGYRLVGGPVDRLVEKARRIGAGEANEPFEGRGRDEISVLSREIDGMCERLAAAREQLEAETAARLEAMEHLRHADRLRTAGQLASGIAHELGTPLNVVSGRAGMIVQGGLTGEEIVHDAEIVKQQADRMATIIRQFLDFARRRAPRRSAVDLRGLLDQTAELLTPLARRSRVRLLVEGDAVTASVDGGQLQQVVTNLTVNAIQASREGGEVRLVLSRGKGRPPDHPDAPPVPGVQIEVRDRGEGIAPEHLDHIFDPFFTTKDVGEGSGLGLAIVYGLVREHGGWIEVRSRPEEGSVFRVFLPLADGATTGTAPAAHPPEAP